MSDQKLHNTCTECGKVLKYAKNMKSHMLKVHDINTSIGTPKVRCLEAGCDFFCNSIPILRKHLTDIHNRTLLLHSETFNTEEDFQKWLCSVQKDHMISFSRAAGVIKRNGCIVKYYNCRRSLSAGRYRERKGKTEGPRQRKMKTTGSCRTDNYCTASLRVACNEDNGEIQVDGCLTHYGHDIEPEHLKLTDDVRSEISSQLHKGVPTNKILKEVATISHAPVKRKDINNAVKKLGPKIVSVRSLSKNAFESLAYIQNVIQNCTDESILETVREPLYNISKALDSLKRHVNKDIIPNLVSPSSNSEAVTKQRSVAPSVSRKSNQSNCRSIPQTANLSNSDDSNLDGYTSVRHKQLYRSSATKRRCVLTAAGAYSSADSSLDGSYGSSMVDMPPVSATFYNNSSANSNQLECTPDISAIDVTPTETTFFNNRNAASNPNIVDVFVQPGH